MKLEELKEDLSETCRADYYQDLHDLSPGQLALFELKDEILALVEAVREDILDENGEPCPCDRPVCATWKALNAKLESL